METILYERSQRHFAHIEGPLIRLLDRLETASLDYTDEFSDLFETIRHFEYELNLESKQREDFRIRLLKSVYRNNKSGREIICVVTAASLDYLTLLIICSFGKFDLNRFRFGKLTDKEWRRLPVAIERFRCERIFFVSTADMHSPCETLDCIRDAIGIQEVDLVILDLEPHQQLENQSRPYFMQIANNIDREFGVRQVRLS